MTFVSLELYVVTWFGSQSVETLMSLSRFKRTPKKNCIFLLIQMFMSIFFYKVFFFTLKLLESYYQR